MIICGKCLQCLWQLNYLWEYLKGIDMTIGSDEYSFIHITMRVSSLADYQSCPSYTSSFTFFVHWPSMDYCTTALNMVGVSVDQIWICHFQLAGISCFSWDVMTRANLHEFISVEIEFRTLSPIAALILIWQVVSWHFSQYCCSLASIYSLWAHFVLDGLIVCWFQVIDCQ